MNRSAAHFDGDDRVQCTDSSLEWLQKPILIREHTKLPRANAKANARMDVLCRGLQPCIALCLQKVSEREDSREAVGGDLSKNVMEACIMCVVIHGEEKGRMSGVECTP